MSRQPTLDRKHRRAQASHQRGAGGRPATIDDFRKYGRQIAVMAAGAATQEVIAGNRDFDGVRERFLETALRDMKADLRQMGASDEWALACIKEAAEVFDQWRAQQPDQPRRSG